jgi:hypothetical protein
MFSHARRGARVTALAGAATLALALGLAQPALATPEPAARPAAPAPLANLAHLDFLLDDVTPPAGVEGHTTYRLEQEPTLVMPWTYADARAGGTFERIGGGPRDPETGHWGQGAFNADDVARAAVVYVRHWQQTGSASSRDSAYELLRSIAYLQTATGPNAGNVVLWMQPDGTLNPSAEPVELPDPSDSGPSYWLARTIWALGEGFAAFERADRDFAAFLEDRLGLAVDALNRQVLVDYGQWARSDGRRVPAWLIVNGADASAEAVLGLAARVEAEPRDRVAADALRKLATGIAAMGGGDTDSWPYGAILPWAESRSMWHAWGSQMPAALAVAADALHDRSLVRPAVRDAAVFTPTLMTAGGPDNGWFPSPTDRVQIAYGADSRVQSLLAVADTTRSRGFAHLAAMQAAWFFGANRSGAAMYDPATGVTYDGLQPDGSVNRNSGAESTIHGLLTMIALDDHPDLAARASTVATVAERDGLRVVEAEAAIETDGSLVSPTSWTGESSWSGQALVLERGEHAVFALGDSRVRVEPVVWTEPGETALSTWRGIGTLRTTGPAQGISPTPGVLLPWELRAPARRDELRVDVTRGSLTLDALLVRPPVSRLTLTGTGGTTQLLHSNADTPQPLRVRPGARVAVYDATGAPVRAHALPPGGFAIVTR